MSSAVLFAPKQIETCVHRGGFRPWSLVSGGCHQFSQFSLTGPDFGGKQKAICVHVGVARGVDGNAAQ